MHEAELVSVGVGDVEVAFAPHCVARRKLRLEPACAELSMEDIDIAHLEDEAPPPGPLKALGAFGNEIEVDTAGAKAAEVRIRTASVKREAQCEVEAEGARHVVRGQGDCAE